MPEYFVPIDLLFESARDFKKAAKDMAANHAKLDKDMNNLEKTWNDLKKQQFFQYYQELDQQMVSCNEVINTIAQQIQAIADRFASVNK